MPIARVQLPDGKVARLEVPDGTTPQQVESFVLENLSKFQTKDFSQPDAPSGLERFGRGMADVAEGLQQGANYLTDRLQGIKGDSAETAAFNAQKTDEGRLYERGRVRGATTQADMEAGRKGDPGMDWMRLAGNIVATTPVMAIPGGAATTLGARAATGAAQGAAASAAMFTPEGESKLKQTLIGAGFGAAAPVVLDAVKMGVRAGINRFGAETMDPAKNGALRKALEQDVSQALQSRGIDWKTLTNDVRDSMLQDAAGALKVGGKLDPKALARKADIQAVGAKPTVASVTRDPRAWQTEKNLRGIQGVGEPIVKREQENAAALVDYLGKIRSGTGGKASTAYEAGESAVNAIKANDAAKEAAVTKLYDAFRASGAQDAAVPATKVADALGKVADEIGTENIPAAVLNRLKEFGLMGGKQTKLLTVNEADKLNRLINNNNPGNGPASLALGRVKGALNQALLDVAPEGQQGVEALKAARAAAAQRFAEADASKGITAALEDVSPDNFVQRFIVKAPVKELSATLAELKKTPEGLQAVKDAKGHILGDLLLKATGATNLDDTAGKAFSGVKFGKALDAIEPEKLHQLFTPEEIGMLRTLQRASKHLTAEVPFSDVNYSKTTAALANLMLKAGNAPILGQIVAPVMGAMKLGADWLKDANARKQVAEALLGGIPAQGAQSASRALPVFGMERAAPVGAAGFGAALTNRPGNSQ